MEAEKFHDLLPAGWRSKKAGGVIQPESKGLRKGIGDSWYKSQCESKSPRARNTNVQWQKKMYISAQAERDNSLFFYLFVLFRPSRGWMMLTCIDNGNLLYSDY